MGKVENTPPAMQMHTAPSDVLERCEVQQAAQLSDRGENAVQAPRLPMPPNNPSVLRKACQIWQHLRACAEKGFENVPESLLR